MNITKFYRPATPGERATQIDELIRERNELLGALREAHIIAADAQLRATYQQTALERISQLAQDAINKAEGRS